MSKPTQDEGAVFLIGERLSSGEREISAYWCPGCEQWWAAHPSDFPNASKRCEMGRWSCVPCDRTKAPDRDELFPRELL